MAMKERRTAALKQVKANYITELYVSNCAKEKYSKVYDELNDRVEKRREEAAIKMRNPCASQPRRTEAAGWVRSLTSLIMTNRCLTTECDSIALSQQSGVKDAQRLRHGGHQVRGGPRIGPG